MTSITALVPTYQRPQDLQRCLEALKKQTRFPDEVLVIVRDIDLETWEFLKSYNSIPLPLQTITATIPGQVAALNLGLDRAQGDFIAITDDDAEPHPNWLADIESYFLADQKVGGVGGRDWVYLDTELHDGKAEVVGKVQWFGRVIGNHHLGVGEAREVDILKGANMSYRKSAIATLGLHFDERLLGTGAQGHNDLAFSLQLRRAGWKLIYDPKVAVNHYPAERFDEDQRCKFINVAHINMVHNETLVLLEYLSAPQRLAFLVWSTFIGTRSVFGIVQLVRFLPHEGRLAWQKWIASMQGRWQGWRTWQSAKQ